jgi:site-specific DNA recombinase
VRASTQRHAQQQTSDQQLARLRAWCADQAWEVRDAFVFRDDGVSGSTLRRPGLDAWRDVVAVAQGDRIVLTAPARRARTSVHHMLVLEAFEQAGCRVVFLDRPMSQDPHDQLLLQMRGAVAEDERVLNHGTDAPRPPAPLAGGRAPALERPPVRLSSGDRAPS